MQGKRKRLSYLSAFSSNRDPLLFRKSLVILLPYWKITLFLTSHSDLGLFYYVYPLLTRDQFVCMITHLILVYLLLKFNNKIFLKQAKPFVEFTLLYTTPVQYWHTYHKSYITCIDPHFLWVQSIIAIIYHPWLYWKYVLDKNFLRLSDFCEGLALILLIMSLSKDKIPSEEMPYVDFISYGNVNKLSPIESLKTKRCHLLGT